MPPSMITLHDFYNVFRGNDSAHGVYELSGKTDEKGKAQGRARTVQETMTEEDVLAHLNGERGLGVIPIKDDARCGFAVIDVDDATQFALIPPIIRRFGFPLIPFRSKSGGLHLYAFFNEPILAKKAVFIMNAYRRALALPKTTEIFPKQTELKQGAIGNWINLPYFACEKTNRYLIMPNGEAADIIQALTYIDEHRVSEEDALAHLNALPLSDAPPCLQAIFIRGSTPMRNNYLFSQAVYLKSKYGDEFEQKLVETNTALEAPLPIKELTDTIINSLKKKDYAYKCQEEPIVSICDKNECKLREFGVGNNAVPALSFEQLTQYMADPPYYEWIVNEKPLRFYTELDIINQGAFRTLCFRVLHVLPMRLKDETWTRIVNTALSNIKVIEIDHGDDISVGAMFKEYLSEFLTKRAEAANKEQILMDRVFKDDELGAFVFRSKNLVSFLTLQKNFRAFGQTEIQARLKDMGGTACRYYINRKNTSMRVWTLPFKALETFVEPDIDQVDINFMEEYENENF